MDLKRTLKNAGMLIFVSATTAFSTRVSGQILGQVLWYKADKGINTATGVPATDNVQLTSWFDLATTDGSQNGTSATPHPATPDETDLPSLPFYRYNNIDNFNFNPVIHFNAVNNGQAVQTITPTKGSQTVIVVFKSQGITGENAFYASGLLYGGDVLETNPTDGDAVIKSDISLAVRSQSRIIVGGGSDGDFSYYGEILLNNMPSIGTFKRDRLGNEEVYLSMYANGSTEISGQNVDPTNTATGEGRDLINAVRIGKAFSAYENGLSSPQGKLNGDVAEVIVYSGVLTEADRAKVESYLAVKYGITLTGGTQQSGATVGNNSYNYVNSTGAIVRISDLNYKYDVFGLGRDDYFELNQKISKSNNSNEILTVSTNSDFSSLNLNTSRTAINGDKEFTLFANNKGSADVVNTQTTELPSGITSRLDREWKITQVNTDGTNIPNISLRFDLSGFSFTGGDITNIKLLIDIDGDGDFTTGAVQKISPNSFTAGSYVQFDNVNISNGHVITLGIVQITDNDNDGIIDNIDLDKDNDGILDTDECGSTNIIERGDFTNLSTTQGFFTPAQFATENPDWVFASTNVGAGNQLFWGNINAPVAFGNGIRFQRDGETQSLTQSITNLYHYGKPQILISKFAANNGNALANSSTLILSYAGVEYMRIATANGINTTSTLTYSNGASGSLTSVAVGTLYNNWVIDLPLGLPSTGDLKIDYLAGPADSDDFSLGDIVINACQDTDSDGIPNFLDLDSDNDGCLDAIEGGDNVTSAQLVAAASGLSAGTGSSATNLNLCAGTGCVDAQGVPTVVNSGGAADISGDQGQGIGFSQSALFNECDSTSGFDCIKPGVAGTPLPTKVGILTKSNPSTQWPQNVPNGHIVLDGAEKGFVITHMTTAQRDALLPVEGMMIYNTTINCVQLYRGTTPSVDSGRTGWNCLETACDGLPQRLVNVGYWGSGGFNFFNDHANFRSQLQNTANYGPTGTFKGITGWNWINANTDINAAAATFTAAQLKAKYDMIVTGWQEMSAASAAKIKQYTDLGGVVFVLMDSGEGTNLIQAFGGTGTTGAGVTTGQKARTLNNTISNGIFGTGGGATLFGANESSRMPVANVPPGAFITGYLNTSGTNVNTINDAGTEFVGIYMTGNQGRAIFVYDEGIYRYSTVAGTVIDTPQEIFIHNLMSYALQRIGFSAQ